MNHSLGYNKTFQAKQEKISTYFYMNINSVTLHYVQSIGKYFHYVALNIKTSFVGVKFIIKKKKNLKIVS